MKNLDLLHEKITLEINEQREKEMADFIAAKQEANRLSEQRAKRGLEALDGMINDFDKYGKFYAEMAEEDEKELQNIRKKYVSEETGEKHHSPEYFRNIGLENAISPCDNRILTPSYAAVFSTKDEKDNLIGGTGTTLYDYNCTDAWDWARGGGNGWFCSGTGTYQVWVEFGYWFLPGTNKYYSISPYNYFRGFYIARAFDGFWTSKDARVVVSIWNNVWQYNWKGWNSVNVLDVGGGNINVNNRFDTERHTYYSALLGGGDWAYVRNVVGLYVRAKGSSSYAELNFSTGAANYLCAPHVHIT